MTPKEWAKWFRNEHPTEKVSDLIIAIRSASKYGFFHKPEYTELVVKELKKLS